MVNFCLKNECLKGSRRELAVVFTQPTPPPVDSLLIGILDYFMAGRHGHLYSSAFKDKEQQHISSIYLSVSFLVSLITETHIEGGVGAAYKQQTCRFLSPTDNFCQFGGLSGCSWSRLWLRGSLARVVARRCAGWCAAFSRVRTLGRLCIGCSRSGSLCQGT